MWRYNILQKRRIPNFKRDVKTIFVTLLKLSHCLRRQSQFSLPRDLAVPGSSPTWGGDLFSRKQDSIAHRPFIFTRPSSHHDWNTDKMDVLSHYMYIHPSIRQSVRSSVRPSIILNSHSQIIETIFFSEMLKNEVFSTIFQNNSFSTWTSESLTHKSVFVFRLQRLDVWM